MAKHQHLNTLERVPPHHLEAEQALVAAMLVDQEAIGITQEAGIEPRMFYRKAHETICQSVFVQAATRKPVDLITIRDHLAAAGTLEEVGGYGYLVDLASSIPTTAHARHYAEIIRDKWLLREQIRQFSQAIADAYEPDADPQAVADALEARKAKLNIAKGDETEVDQYGAIDKFNTQYYERMEAHKSGKRRLLEFGMEDLDNHLGGLEPGDFVLLGARPSMGKTAMALNMFYNVSRWGRPRFHSLEMSTEAIMDRVAAMVASVDGMKIRKGDLDQAEQDRIALAVAEVAERRFAIDDGATLTFERLRRAVMRDVARGNRPPLIMVDYIGLMETGKAENRNLAVGNLSRQLKNLAREAQTVVVALSQLSRKVEERTDKRPMMSDLRESGSLEQDADVIMFLYRDEYYNKDTDRPGVVEINIAKHRKGSVGMVEMYLEHAHQRFLPIAATPIFTSMPAASFSAPTGASSSFGNFEGVPYGEFD